MPHSFMHLFILPFGLLVGVVVGGRSTSLSPLQHHLSSSDDNHFTGDVPGGKEWVEDSLVHAHPQPSTLPVKYSSSAPNGYGKRPRYPYPVIPPEHTLPYYYTTGVEVTPQELYHVRQPHTDIVTGGGGHGHSQKYLIRPQQPHLSWSSAELPRNNGHSSYQLITIGGQGWGRRPGPKTNSNNFGVGTGGEWTGAGDNGLIPFSQQQNRRGVGGGQVNFAAVSLLGLLALMGTIQHVMTDLDSSLTLTNQPNTDFETGNSISGNRPRPLPSRPLRPTPTLRPFPQPSLTSRPSGSNGRPTSSSSGQMSTTTKKPTRHKNRN